MSLKPKLFTLLKEGIPPKQIITDTMAGLVVGVVALPLAIAFAIASGVSPEKGLITAVIAGLIISIFGGSRVQIGGPTGAFIVIVYSIIEKYGMDGLFISTIIAGLFLVTFGILRLGNLLKYFPQPLITGFTSAIALVIFSTQINDALGLNIKNVPSEFIEKWALYFENLDKIDVNSIGITFTTILIIIISKRFIPKAPGSFIALIIITGIVNIFRIPVSTIGTNFGEIPNTFSFSLPDLDPRNFHIYISPGLTIALLGGIESLLSATVADGMIGGNHRSNIELIAQGAANIFSTIFGGIPATGAIARTATNIHNGGRTPIAGIVHSLTLLIIMLFLGKLAVLIPMPCLAGILVMVAWNMSEIRLFISTFKNSIFDILIMLTTFFLTVLVDLTVAIETGVVLSAVLFMKRMADSAGTHLDEEIESDFLEDYSDLPESISIYEISGPFFFASAKQYAEIIKETGRKSRALVLRLRHVPFIDQTGIHNLYSAIKNLKKQNIHVILSGTNRNVHKALKKSEVLQLIDESNIFDSFKEALNKAKEIVS